MSEPIEVANGLIRQGFKAVRLTRVCGIRLRGRDVGVGVDGGADYVFDAGSVELAQQAAQTIIAAISFVPGEWTSWHERHYQS